jgi:hypothetical protein
MTPDPTTAPANPPSGSAATPETKTFLIAATKRAAVLGKGLDVTSVASELRKYILYSSNARQKGQDEVHIKRRGSTDYAVFRFDGAWKFHGTITATGQPGPVVDAKAVAFELYALLLMRQDAKLEDRIVKPDPYALTRQVTQEERDICKRVGRPPDLRSKAAYDAVKHLLRLVKEESQ